MKVIVDTCIWSLALRRHKNSLHETKIISELKNLITDSRIQMLGLIRQELLAGISSIAQFDRLKKYLNNFPDFQVQTNDHVLAAEYFNECRAKGIQGSAVDFFICAVSTNNQLPILTVDKDFKSYAKLLPINVLIL
ncbi:MAG TPA: PIN domain-containing protein [Gammaproteobacteria bacterium]|jgi:hypothetical protein|nr:PIN domain-containing protein [Gammaproteobacteria bacterium]